MKKLILMMFIALGVMSCNKEKEEDVLTDTSVTDNTDHTEQTAQENLDNGVSILEILKTQSVHSLYGKTYEGGLIFYVDEATGTGLVAATTDQSSAAAWGCNDTEITGTARSGIGTGAQNTLDILAGCSEDGIAAKLCADLTLNGKDDWFLPSRYELDAMYNNLHVNGYGGFSSDSDSYWSSTEYNSNFAWYYYFYNGGADAIFKDGTYRVRAVRAF